MTQSATPRRMVLLTDGYNDFRTAKTAICLLRYRPEEVVAIFDRSAVGKTSQEHFGLGGSIPCIGNLADAPTANTLTIGIAPPGGKVPSHWRPIMLEAIAKKMTILSGLHEFLHDDPEFRDAAVASGAKLVDVRDNDEHDVANRIGIREGCLRIHTVGNDCSIGKMVVSVEVTNGLTSRGIDAQFVATGQTGIMLAGSGCPIDRVISDFVNGAAERLVLANQHHDVILIEGQGSLFHPRYSCVTLGLLHGSMPDGLILCYEMGRTKHSNMEYVPLPPLEKVRAFYEAAANIMNPCQFIGIAINGHDYTEAQVAEECQRIEGVMGLPACDVIRHGPAKLVDAVLQLKQKLGK